MSSFSETAIIGANDVYASKFTHAEASLPLPPGKEFAILTCMDARIHPPAVFGLALGDAHIIRNAGGSAKDGLRSLVISQQLLGTKVILVVKHTDCGMLTFQNEDIREVIKKNLGKGAASKAEAIEFLPFKDLTQAVKDDVEFLKGNELIPEVVKENISGWIYHVETGRLEKVV